MALYEDLILDDPGRLTRQAIVSGVGTGLSQGMMFSLYWIAFLCEFHTTEGTLFLCLQLRVNGVNCCPSS